MATRIVRTGEAQDVLAYLNSFPDDRLRYIIDPDDSRQVIVENQKIFESDKLSVGQTFQLTSAGKTYLCKVAAQSLWNPTLILVEGQQLHNVKNDLSFALNISSLAFHSPQSVSEYMEITSLNVKQTIEEDETKKNKQPENEALQTLVKLKSLASNIITIISDVEPQDLGSRPTRTSPDDGTQTPPPTRNSDGTRVPDPTRNSPDGYRRAVYAEENIPLTEYWLNRAQQHNCEHQESPVVAIMDTGIDFRYDWTMGREKITQQRGLFSGESMPDCPLWFNETNTQVSLTCDPDDRSPKVQILQKDYIGWNFVGTGRVYSNQHPNPYDDDSANKHGTRIAAIIAQQTDWNARLMILKTHDYRGVGLLFNIFCAFDYLLQRSEGVKIVNASWGYYGAPIVRLQDYLRELEERGIWFVNAAGNQTDFYDDYHGHELKMSITPTTKSPTERYPACFSNAANLIVTVTTAKNRWQLRMTPPRTDFKFKWQIVENYSNQFVDVAVGAGRDGCFPEPLAENNATIKGSSYATAYFTGRLARYLTEGGIPSRILRKFCQKIPNSESSILQNQVREGYFLMADMDFIEEAY